MALFLYQPGIQPLGQYDFLDADLESVLGGELATLAKVGRANSSTEKGSYDARDGYVADLIDAGNPTQYRTVARIADGEVDDGYGILLETSELFYLTDDGKTYYGTSVNLVGDVAGLGTAGAQVGAHTASASGKVTLWDKPGLYGVSSDALAADVLGGSNLYDTPLPGELLYREHNTGKLTRATDSLDKVAVFVELRGNGSLVTTPGKLVGAAETLDRVVIRYFGAGGKA